MDAHSSGMSGASATQRPAHTSSARESSAPHSSGYNGIVVRRCERGSAWWWSTPFWVTSTSGAKARTAGAMTCAIAMR